MLILISVATLCSGLRGFLMELASYRINLRLRKDFFKSILQQEMAFFDSTSTGDLLSRLTSDITIMSDTVTQNINIFLRSGLKVVIQTVLMWKCSWKLTVLTFMVVPLVSAISKIYGNYYKKLQEAVLDRIAYANITAEEVLSSIFWGA